MWLYNQRRNKHNLTLEQQRKLEELPGFTWEVKKKPTWEECYQQVVRIFTETGDQPNKRKHINQYYWLYYQRRNKHNLTEEQQQKLEALSGFTWEIKRNLTWEECYQETLQIFKETGKPPNYKEHTPQYDWLRHQRKRKKRLTAEQQHKLEALPGFVWNGIVKTK